MAPQQLLFDALSRDIHRCINFPFTFKFKLLNKTVINMYKKILFTTEKDKLMTLACHDGKIKIIKSLNHKSILLMRFFYDDRLDWAARNGHLEVVMYLHQNGMDVINNTTPICWAAAAGHLDVVKYLHQSGADIKARENYALCYAAKYGFLLMVKYLCENGADITADDNLPIRWASLNGHRGIVQYLRQRAVLLTH